MEVQPQEVVCKWSKWKCGFKVFLLLLRPLDYVPDHGADASIVRGTSGGDSASEPPAQPKRK